MENANLENKTNEELIALAEYIKEEQLSRLEQSKFITPIAYCAEHNILPENGTRLRTKSILGSTGGMLINAKYLDARKPNAIGTYYGHVPGHGGDVWWVKHDDGSESAYMFNEVEDLPMEANDM